MAISTTIPQSWKLPLFWAVVDGSKAGNLSEAHRALLVGQALAGTDVSGTSSTSLTVEAGPKTFVTQAGLSILPGMRVRLVDVSNALRWMEGVCTAYVSTSLSFDVDTGNGINSTASSWKLSVTGNFGQQPLGVPTPVGSVELAGRYFGVGSMLWRMAKAFFASNANQQLWAVAVAEPTGQKAGGVITISHAPSASGLLTIYIAGQKVEVAIASTNTAAQVAAKLCSAINGNNELPVNAVVGTDTSEVELTCRWIGATGNDITIVPNYRGLYGNEALPVGLALRITAMSGGTGEPDFTAAISAIQMLEYDYVALPYTDSGSLSAWNTEYGFGPTGRWAYSRQQYGFVLTARRDTYANLVTWGLAQDAPVISTLGIEVDSPAPIWEWSAAYCAIAALGFSDDPARPLQTLEMYGLLPARLQNRFSAPQINALANSGIAVQATAPSGNPMMMIEQTQYQFNSYGQADTAFGLLTVLATLQELLRRMKSAITTKYPRVKLVPDGTRLGPGQAAVTPTDIRAELVSEFMGAMRDGLVADLKDFKDNLIAEIDPNNPNRVNVLWPPQLAGQLRQFAALAQFRLMYPVPA